MDSYNDFFGNSFEEYIRKYFPKLNNVIALSAGGQKLVFTANHPEYDDIVLKIIKPNLNDYERTVREIRASHIIESNNIPKILDSNVNGDISSDIIWIMEEYISGNTLRHYLNNKYTFSLSDVANFIETMLNILIQVEECNMVHRDIKPENIIYNDKIGKFWLIDFGLARHLDLESITDSNEPFGLCTWGYAASEQFRNLKKDINIRADLFSIGVVTYELLTGFNPFIENANDIFQVINNIEKVPLPMFRVNGDTQYLLATYIKTLADNRLSRRPKSAREALDVYNTIKPTLQY